MICYTNYIYDKSLYMLILKHENIFQFFLTFSTEKTSFHHQLTKVDCIELLYRIVLTRKIIYLLKNKNKKMVITIIYQTDIHYTKNYIHI